MKKCLISALMIATTLNCMTFGASAQTQTSLEPELPLLSESVITQYNLSVNDAVKMALEYSPQLECHDVNKKNAEITLNSAYSAQRDSKNVPIYASQNFELNFVKKGYYVEAAKSQIKLLSYEKTKIESAITYDVINKYYTAKNALRMRDIASSAVDRAKANQVIIKAQYDLGACTMLDVQNAEIALNQAVANFEKCQNACVLATDSLRIILGVENEAIINLNDDIIPEEFNANLESDIEKAMSQRYDVIALKENTILTKKYFEIASVLSEKGTTYYNAYKNSISAEYNLNTGIDNIKLLIKSAYFNIAEAHTNTVIAKSKLDLAQKNYEVNKLKGEMGMISSMTLSASSDELTLAENTYQNELFKEKLAIEKYKYEILIGL